MSYSSVKGSVSRGASGVLALVQRQLDRVVSPDARQKTYNTVVTFANERPFLASFIFTHLFFSCIPLIIFSIFILSTAIFAVVTALLFTLFWLGVALLVLVPTLMLTSAAAFATYAWGLSSYVFVRQVSGWVPGLDGRLWAQERAAVNGEPTTHAGGGNRGDDDTGGMGDTDSHLL